MNPRSDNLLRPHLRHVELLCLQARRMRAIPRLLISAGGDPDRLFEVVCAEAPALFLADGAAVFVDDGSGLLRLRVSTGLPPGGVGGITCTRGEMSELADQDGEVTRLDGRLCESIFLTLYDAGWRSLMWAQLRSHGRVAGGLLIARHDEERPFDEDDILYAEVLGTFLGAQIVEMELSERILRLQRALREAVQRIETEAERREERDSRKWVHPRK